MSPTWIKVLRAAGSVHIWRRGTVLMREGEPADRVLLLERGLVKITSESATGYTSLLALRGPGELVGELSCVDGGPRSATATAMGSVAGVAVPVARFEALLGQQDGLALAVLRMVAWRLRDADGQRGDFGARSASVRTALALARLAGRYGTPVPGAPAGSPARRLAVTQQELAGAAGSSRESVVRVLRQLGEAGLVVTSRGMVLVVDPVALVGWSSGASGT
ncbi:Crp/Fnr family transcriptional regulator [Kitasatospora sp. NBC_00070]|uniref:Crp/Fnr family transcriptional regulator n=1 Tax=Kitasatospora sp. NBC_00070 TaxID=2975962 RepID=UPI0032461277